MRARLLIVAVVVVLASAAFAAWSVMAVRDDLLAARGEAARLRQALDAGKQQEAKAALGHLQEHSGSAADRTDGPVFEVLSWLPVVGDDVDGIRRLSRASQRVSVEGLHPLMQVIDDLSADAFLPRDGRVPVDEVAALQRPMAASTSAFSKARRELGEGDPREYVSPVASAYSELQRLVEDVTEALVAASTAADLLPPMLGADGPRRYLAIFQNNAELRTTGGLPGAAALMEADDGRISLGRQTGSLPHLDRPVLPLSRAERELYDEQLGTFYQDANFIPHFPRTAELVAAHWERQFGQRVDGVLSVDPVALSYLLEGTGPVTVQDVELTADNAVDVLLHETYQRLPPEQQDAFFAETARVIFARLSSGEGDARTVLEALTRAAREGRVLVTSFDESEQGRLRGTTVAGEVAREDAAPQLGVYLQDATESKLTYFLDYEVTDVEVESCHDGVKNVTGTLRLNSRAPRGGRGLSESVLGSSGDFGRRGDQLVQVELHAPQGGTITRVLADGKKRPVWPTALLGHDVAQTFLVVQAQGTHEVAFTMTAPVAVEEVDVRVTPGVERERESRQVRLTC